MLAVCWLAAFSLAGCSLEGELDVALAPYAPQAAVEAYLTPGEPFRLLLTRSADFFAELPEDDVALLEETLLAGAEVRIRYGAEEVVLAEALGADPLTGRFFNYGAAERVPANFVDSFHLEVDLPGDGGGIRASTLIRRAVAIEENAVAWGFDGDGLRPRASLTTYLVDPDTTRVNHFRKTLTYAPRDSAAVQDFVFNDELADQARLSTGTDYEFVAGDTLFVFLAHVDAAYERYATSLLTAVASNGNPFAQPSPILGNVRGVGGAEPLGIFAGYDYALEVVVVPPE